MIKVLIKAEYLRRLAFFPVAIDFPARIRIYLLAMEGCVAGAEAASVACAVYAKAATDVVAALCRLHIKNYYR